MSNIIIRRSEENKLLNTEANDNSNLLISRDYQKLFEEVIRLRKERKKIDELYKIKCKAELAQAVEITKLKQKFEDEIFKFKVEDHSDLLKYLTRQLSVKDKILTDKENEINALKTEIYLSKADRLSLRKSASSQLSLSDSSYKNLSLSNDSSLFEDSPCYKKGKVKVIKPDSNSAEYGESKKLIKRLKDKIKELEAQLSKSKHHKVTDGNKELLALNRKLSLRRSDSSRVIRDKKEEEIKALKSIIEDYEKKLNEAENKSPLSELVIRKITREKLILEKQLCTILSKQPTTTHDSSGRSSRSSLDVTVKSNAIDPVLFEALQDTNEALKAEVARLSHLEHENTALRNQLNESVAREAQKDLDLIKYSETCAKLEQTLQEESKAGQTMKNEFSKKLHAREKEIGHLKSTIKRLSDENSAIQELHKESNKKLLRLQNIETQYEDLKIRFDSMNSDYENICEELNDIEKVRSSRDTNDGMATAPLAKCISVPTQCNLINESESKYLKALADEAKLHSKSKNSNLEKLKREFANFKHGVNVNVVVDEKDSPCKQCAAYRSELLTLQKMLNVCKFENKDLKDILHESQEKSAASQENRFSVIREANKSKHASGNKELFRRRPEKRQNNSLVKDMRNDEENTNKFGENDHTPNSDRSRSHEEKFQSFYSIDSLSDNLMKELDILTSENNRVKLSLENTKHVADTEKDKKIISELSEKDKKKRLNL